MYPRDAAAVPTNWDVERRSYTCTLSFRPADVILLNFSCGQKMITNFYDNHRDYFKGTLCTTSR